MDLLIVGNGVAGITCALEVRKRDPGANITVVGGETPYFYSRTALMYAFMDQLSRRDLEPFERKTWAQQRITLKQDWVTQVDGAAQTAQLKGGETLRFDKLVLALGASPRRAYWKGLDAVKDGLVNLVSMQDLDACERLTPSTTEAVVVGGGLIGIELVECLTHFGVKTSFLIREPYYWPMALGAQEAAMVEAHLKQRGVNIITRDEVAEVHADSQGRFSGLTTGKGLRLNGQMLGVAIGVEPNVASVKAWNAGIEVGRGIRVDERLQTANASIYAAGDCVEIVGKDGKSTVELIWYSAKRQGALVARNVLGEDTDYQAPVFFNSSKFFDIEFTTVGDVVNVPDGTPSIYRELPGKLVSQRIVHDGEKVLGFNLLGSRWNHGILSQWISEKRPISYVMEHLAEAQFDVEFGRIDLKSMTETPSPMRKEAA